MKSDFSSFLKDKIGDSHPMAHMISVNLWDTLNSGHAIFISLENIPFILFHN